VLIKALPPTALVRTPVDERVRDPWTAYHELLAQLVEVVSIGAAEMKLRRPIKVNRPGSRRQHAQAEPVDVKRAQDVPGDNPYRAAMAVLSRAQPSRVRQAAADSKREQETR